MRTVSNQNRSGRALIGSPIMSPGSTFDQTPTFARFGRHPQLGGNYTNAQFLNRDFFDVAPFSSGSNAISNGAPAIPSTMSYGNGANIGWLGQDYGLYEAVAGGLTDINTQPGSSQGDSRKINGTCRSGELGNDIVNVGSGGVLLPWRSRAGASNGNFHNFGYVNADLPDRSRALIMYQGFLYGVDRLQPYLPGVNGALASRYSRKQLTTTASTSITSQLGTASYNRVRREFLVSSTDSTTTHRLHFRLYRNVDLTSSENVQDRLSESAFTEVSFNVPAAAWPIWNQESRFRHSPVLCDNGDVIVSFFATNNTTSGGIGLCTIRFVRTGEASWSVPASYSVVASHGATYGHDNDSGWAGMKTMQTRDGNVVFSFAHYYYWGAGLVGVFMDKRTGEVTPVSIADTGNGVNVLHYDEDGFALYRCQPDYETTINYADLWVRKPNGGMVALPQKHISKHLWQYHSSYTNCFSAMLEVLK